MFEAVFGIILSMEPEKWKVLPQMLLLIPERQN